MKKIISFISAVAIVATCFTSLTFAATKPTMKIEAEKVADFSGKLADYADAEEDGFEVWLINFIGTGINLTTTTSGSLKKLNGDSITGYGLNFDATCDLVVGDEWSGEYLNDLVGSAPSAEGWTGDHYGAAVSGVNPIYPAKKTAHVGSLDEEVVLYQMVFLVVPESPAVLTFGDCYINVGNFDNNDYDEAESVAYKTSEKTLTLSAPSITLPKVEEQSTYTIAFKDWDGSPLGSDTYEEGATVTAPTASREGYTFNGWSPAFSSTATADATYTAQYSPIKVSSITLDKASLSLKIGGTGNVAVSSVLPSDALDKTYTWSSTNTSVATVSGGTVTAVGIGTATIKATANDGSGKYGECTVTVTKEPVTGITITGSANATVGDNVQLSATVAPSNATYKTVTWSKVSGSGDVSSTGVVTATAAGAVTARATADGVTKDFTVTFAPKTYTIAFKTYNGEGADIQSGSSYKYGDTVTVPGKASAPARSGYVFAGWAEKTNGTLSDRVDPTTTATADKTYYAVYVQIPTDTPAASTEIAAYKGDALTKLDSTSAGTADADYYGGKVNFTANTEFFGYQVVLKGHKIGSSEIEEKVCDPLTIGAGKNIELSGSTASFTVLVKTTTRVITDILIRAFEQ